MALLTPEPSINVVTPTGTSVGPWPTGFTYAEAADLWVYLLRDGVQGADLALGADYAVTGANPTVDGGSVALYAGAVPVGGWLATDRVVIRRWTARRQATALPDTEGHKPRATESALDRAMRIAQENSDDLDLAVKVPVGQTPPTPDQIVAPALVIAEAAETAAAGALEQAQAAQSQLAAALSNGVTNIAGSFARFPAGGSDVTATGGETTVTMIEAVANALLVRLWRNGVEQRPGIDYTVNGTTTLTLTTALIAGETVRGQHVGGQATTITPAFPGARARTLAQRAADHFDVYDWLAVMKDGLSNDGPGLVAALTAGRVVGHSSGVIRVTSNETLPVSDFLVTGGKIHIEPAATLTVDPSGRFEAPRWAEVFIGGGEVRGLTEAEVAWFGAAGDYDEAHASGDSPTDDTANLNRAARAAQVVRLLDRAYAIGGRVSLAPTLAKAAVLEGRGWSKAGAGSRLYATHAGAGVDIDGTLGLSDPSAQAEFGLRHLALLPSNVTVTRMLDISGDGGGANDTLTGLTSNVIENVVIGDALDQIRIGGVTKLRLRNVYARSGAVFGNSVRLWQPEGCVYTTEIAFEGCVLAQPETGGGGGRAVFLDHADVSVGSAASSHIRGVTFDDDCQLYAGRLGHCFYVASAAAVGKERTWGDITFAPGTKMQGAADLSSLTAFYADSKDGAKGSTINLFPGQIEGFAGDAAIDIKNTATVATFGDTSDVKIMGATFRYVKERAIRLSGVHGAQIVGNTYQYCGLTGATADAHIDLIECKAVRVENQIAGHDDATSWPGLDTGVKVAGAATANVTSRGNALGTTDAVDYDAGVTDPNSGDSADQPSVTVQV